MNSRQVPGVRDQFLVGRFDRLKTIDVRMRNLICIFERRLPDICAYVECDSNLVSAIPASYIEEYVHAVRHCAPVDAGSSESFNGLFGFVSEFG
jgi:hypothetical protein